MTKPVDRLREALRDRYLIESELGAGGMATVYLAEDVKHHRKVAVKVLRPELAAVLGADRFLQEIETTANLQHPHILPLFDSGEADSFLYYVMPFIDGESLRDKLDRETQLGVEESVRIASDIADALHYAHEQSVIHRDIKPENIMLQNGRPVVADFGIALAVSAAAGTRMTETGLSLGTPHYMSPEQATADKDLSNRSDIYSLGAVLYEMLTGDPPHTGSSAQQIIMKIVTEDAQDITKLRKTVPPNVAAAVAKSVEKLPADRFETAAKFAEALSSQSFSHSATYAAGLASASSADRLWKPLTFVLGATTVVATIAALWSFTRPDAPLPVVRANVQLPQEQRALDSRSYGRRSIAISPDGSRYAYLGLNNSGGVQIWVRDLGLPNATPINGTDGACCPTFSPDGRSIAFIVNPDQRLRVVDLDAGIPREPLSGTTGIEDLHWGSDGYLYTGSGGVVGTGLGMLRRLSLDGSSSNQWEQLTSLDHTRREDTHASPVLLPNGRGVLFTVNFGDVTTPSLAVLDLSTGVHRLLIPGAAPNYVASGHVVYGAADGSLMAAPFDQDRMEFTGPPRALGGNISVRGLEGVRDVSASANGTVLYVFGEADREHIVWVDRSGAHTYLDTTWVADFETVALSGDGTQMAVSIAERDGQHLWIYSLPSGPVSKLTIAEGVTFRPSWSGGGDRLLYVSSRALDDAPWDLYTQRANGGTADLVLDLDRDVWEGEWSPNGEWLIYRTGVPPTRDLFVKHTHPDSVGRTISASDQFQEVMPTLSPDGRWLAYQANETGRYEIYVRPFPNIDDDKRPVSVSGGTEPVWSRDGSELFYKNLDRELVAAKVDARTGFSITEREVLFSVLDYQGGDEFCCHPTYDVSLDGSRFLMIRRTEGPRRCDLDTKCARRPGIADQQLRVRASTIRRCVE